MTTSTLPQTRTRKRTRFLGLAAMTVVLGTTLTACGGNDLDNATCGEIKDMSTDEFFDFMKDAAEDDGSDDAKELVDGLEALPDDQRGPYQEAFVGTICEGEDDGTKLKDTEFGN
ncbi:hypothetical protein [Nocardioides sp. 1609]|uniref:hypothetical protein n=1 Tax=Nocardioides sp. 1609 TaxID=2508327 RepID=UPI0010703473|nr:hypothetical protein [Nocardioides sp. 1609]